jgi:hypothetical protein
MEAQEKKGGNKNMIQRFYFQAFIREPSGKVERIDIVARNTKGALEVAKREMKKGSVVVKVIKLGKYY